MFSMRYLAIFTLIATALALPTTEKPINQEEQFLPSLPAPWFNVPFIGDITKIFEPLWKFIPNFDDLGPRIDVSDDNFQVIVPVKEFSKDDLKVKVKKDFIFVQGAHEAKDAEHDLFASQFFHTYTLPANSSAADVTAQLTTDGYLIVNAPITSNVDKSKEADRVVPITESGEPYKKDAASTPAIPETPEAPEIPESPEIISPESKQPEASSTSVPEQVSEEDRKEPTTPPSEREEATENNVIPHGNEVTL